MPLHIQKRKSKYCVVEPNGKVLGCHPSRTKAVKQIAAIEASKARKKK